MTTVETGTVPPTRRWVSAMRASTVLAVGATVALLLDDATAFDLLITIAAVLALLVAGVVWLVCAPIGCARYRRYGTVLVAPLVVLAGIGAVAAGIPDRVAWWLSESALTEVARGRCAESDAGWIGVIRVSSVADRDGGCLFGIGDSLGGLAYFPAGARPPVHVPTAYQPVYTPFDGNWYRYSVDVHDGH
ncbi:hypothetical protein ACFWM1_12590 [Nocardia sp. NPDC058379]|uniref:hypothetical protein n=1 Tax=unclassified Nocardia TaxID=2637762 RepID=UPI0036676461